MLIACWMFLTRIVFPQMGNFLAVLINAAMPIIIMGVGLTILVAAVGVRANFSLMGTVCNAIISALGYIGRTIISAIGWALRHLVLFIPVFYSGTRNSLVRGGISEGGANILAVIATIFLIAVII